MNLDFEIKNRLREYQKPISDFKLIKEYEKEKGFVKEEILKFVENYCQNDFPIQYLVGFEYFFDKKVLVNKNVLIPRMETEEVVLAFVKAIKKKYSKTQNISILDLCTGSGAIIIGIHKYLKDFNITYYASDVSQQALEVAYQNFKNHKIKVSLIKSDLFSNFDKSLKFDAIISNPPYLDKTQIVEENVVKYEPNIALFANDFGMSFYKEIFLEMDYFLKEKAIICFEIGYNQGNEITKLIINHKKHDEFVIIKDINNFDRICLLFRG